jgi:5,6-dimethylbenzimidazole synthase
MPAPIDPPSSSLPGSGFTDEERRGLYKAILTRRDVRGHFRPDPVPPEILSRILVAAHHAPSVGFMQPWDFIVITDLEQRRRIHGDFLAANEEAAELFVGTRQALYRSLKLEGILEAPLNLCVTCHRDRAGPVVLGRTHISTMDLYSSVCAVENLWLAARAEGLGVGWVSILHEPVLRAALALPEPVVPVAYLCLGYVSHFLEQPELQAAGWRRRLPLPELVHYDRWGGQPSSTAELPAELIRCQELAEQGSLP